MPVARPVEGVGNPQGPEQWFYDLPIITRSWFAATMVLTCAANFGLIDAYRLVYIWENITSKFEIWRIATCFCFAGGFSFNTLIAIYMLVQFSKQYETGGPFNTGAGGGTADYAFAMLFGMLSILATYPLAGMIGVALTPIFNKNLTFFVLYVWSKRNPTAQANVWGVPIAAIYLPFAYLALNIFMGNPSSDMVHGLIIGHIYYFLADVYPSLYGKDLLKTPQFMIDQFGIGMYTPPQAPAAAQGGAPAGGVGWNAQAPPGNQQQARATGGHNWGTGGQSLGRD